eukprot:tig00021038_g17518.t1
MILAKHNKIQPLPAESKLVDIESQGLSKPTEGTYAAPTIAIHGPANGTAGGTELTSIFGVAPPPSVYSAATKAVSTKGEILQQQVYRDLSSRAFVFREKIIEEFRLKDEILEENSENAPQYSSTEVVRDEKLMTKVLFEKPTQLVRFKIFKRSAENKDQKIDRRLIRVRNINTVPLGVWAAWVVDSKFFNILVNAAIILNCVMMGIQSELKDEDYMAPTLPGSSQWIDNFEKFWQSGWNIFDFLVTFLSIIPEIIVAASGPTRAGDKNVITIVARQARTPAPSSKQFGYIALLMMLLFYLYAVFGVASFSSYSESNIPGLNYQHKFSDFGAAMLTLFQMLTLDQWYKMCMEISKYTVAPITIVYFMTWVWIGAFIFRNIFIGVMVRNFRAISAELAKQAKDEAKKRKLERMLKKLNQRFRNRDGATAPGEGPALSANLLEALNKGGDAGSQAESQVGSQAGSQRQADDDAPASVSDEASRPAVLVAAAGADRRWGGRAQGGKKQKPESKKGVGFAAADEVDEPRAKLAAWVRNQEPGPPPPMTDRAVAAEREGLEGAKAAIAQPGSGALSVGAGSGPASGALQSLGPDAESFRPNRRGSVQFGASASPVAAVSSDPALGTRKRGGLKKTAAVGASGTPAGVEWGPTTTAEANPPTRREEDGTPVEGGLASSAAMAPVAAAAAAAAAGPSSKSPEGDKSPEPSPPESKRESPVPDGRASKASFASAGEEGKKKKSARFGPAEDDPPRASSPVPAKKGVSSIRFSNADEEEKRDEEIPAPAAGSDDGAGAGAGGSDEEGSVDPAEAMLSKLNAGRGAAEGIDAFTHERWAREQDDIADVIATVAAYKKETLWPRDTLFAYLQSMEGLMEVIREHEELMQLASMALVGLHDTD